MEPVEVMDVSAQGYPSPVLRRQGQWTTLGVRPDLLGCPSDPPPPRGGEGRGKRNDVSYPLPEYTRGVRRGVGVLPHKSGEWIRVPGPIEDGSSIDPTVQTSCL